MHGNSVASCHGITYHAKCIMPSANIDIVQHILRYTNISDVEHTVTGLMPGVTDANVEECRAFRCNPNIYLRKLTKHSDDLLDVMGELSIVLSGSRAADYFCPGLCNEDSDWDFYCDGSADAIVRFSTYMNRIGVVWQEMPVGASEELQRMHAGTVGGLQRDAETSEYQGSSVLRGALVEDGTSHTIQLIWDRMRRTSPISQIISFHSSIVQCFISGFCAVSMYDSLTRRNESLAWICHDDELSAAAREKYTNRGVKYVSYDVYMDNIREKRFIEPAHVRKNEMTLASPTVSIVLFPSRGRLSSSADDAVYDIRRNTEWYDIGYTCTTNSKNNVPTLHSELNRVGAKGNIIETVSQRTWCTQVIMSCATTGGVPSDDQELMHAIQGLVPWITDRRAMGVLLKCVINFAYADR